MAQKVQIIGTYISPYVRKVLVCLDIKGVSYEIDPITPFLGNDRFSKLSPIRRIPVLIDDKVTLCDSSVICQYLEDRYPTPPIFPSDVADRARARWLEEYADTRMGEVLIWGLFNQKVVKPFIWGEPTDDDALAKTLEEDIPQVLGYLETQVPADGFLFGALSIADISIATFFRNAAFARFRVDAERWPKTAAFVDRVLASESFQKLKPFEEKMMRTPPPQHREALAAIGAPLMAESYGTNTPRRGMMKI
ncbi:MAG: glutathione S-transferase family protein [Deltaproteobacteria bacterium]|nr:glutathione S-transferase family protein [Deltaproteobacteria bacterium]